MRFERVGRTITVMSEEYNPYAPPKQTSTPPDNEGVWRKDGWLVVSHAAELPTQWCVKTNEPATRVTTLWDMGAQFKGFVYTREVGLKESLYHRRLLRSRIALAAICSGLPLSVFCVLADWMFDPGFESSMYLLPVAIVLLSVGVVCLFINLIQLSAPLITRTHGYIHGVHPDFLARFPEWPRS